jgi:hypothetical protein
MFDSFKWIIKKQIQYHVSLGLEDTFLRISKGGYFIRYGNYHDTTCSDFS